MSPYRPRRSVTQVTFPVPIERLSGRRILAIAIPRDGMATAFFASGIAHWSGTELRVSHHHAAPPMTLTGSVRGLAGFDPAALPGLIVAPHRAEVLRLAVGAAACVVAVTDETPRDVLAIEAPFFGLAMSKDCDQVFLMQGSDPH
jgi:hypothetical protein